jgi:hypothetical protein
MDFTQEQLDVCNKYVMQISNILTNTDKNIINNDTRLSFWCCIPTLKIDNNIHNLNESTIWPVEYPFVDWPLKQPFIEYIIECLREKFNIETVFVPYRDNSLNSKHNTAFGYVYYKITMPFHKFISL